MNHLLLKQKIAAYCTEHQIMGMLRVTRSDRILYTQSMGFADREARVPFGDDSMFTLYSLSKPFCAVGLLRLYDRGDVSLDVHPSVYVEEAAGFDARLTVRHLLHHVSGLPDFEQDRAFAMAHPSGEAQIVREQLPLLAALPQHFAPGEAAMYANVNFVLTALIIESVSGMAYADYMKQYVLTPFGMPSAIVDRKGLTIPNRVQGYALGEDGEPVPVPKSYDWLHGAGDLVGTVEDVYCLGRAIREGRVLQPETWRMALTPHPINHMGMGCTVTLWHGRRRITHNGGHWGFRTLHIYLPEEDFDLVFLSNSGYGDARNDLSELIYAHFFGEAGDTTAVPMDTGYINA